MIAQKSNLLGLLGGTLRYRPESRPMGVPVRAFFLFRRALLARFCTEARRGQTMDPNSLTKYSTADEQGPSRPPTSLASPASQARQPLRRAK